MSEFRNEQAIAAFALVSREEVDRRFLIGEWPSHPEAGFFILPD